MKNIKIIIIASLVSFVITSLAFTILYLKLDNSAQKDKGEPWSLSNTTTYINTQLKQSANNQIDSNRQTIITQTVKEVSAAVVGINVTAIKEYRDIFSLDPFWRYWFGDRVYKQQVKSLGSGVIVSPDGYIVTNDHVAGDAVEVIVTLTDGSQYNAKVVGTDKVSDICLLKIDSKKELPFIRMGNSDDVMIGEWVIALGNPFGFFEINDKPTVTVGVISSTGMNLGVTDNRYYVNMLQTDAAINSGNSGGPLVNAVGELIGINTLIYNASGTGGNIGVGFAIPVNKIRKIITELKEHGKVDRDFWTGLSIQTVDEGIAKYYNLKQIRGVIITNIAKGSPAEKAGLQVYDIIIGVNNYMINDENTLIGVLQEFRAGDVINLKITRNNVLLNKQMKLEKR
ncbi:S1C family serine protease [Melioribacteraceae bacterium 4301-Me]|uniref:S1C family serine protease n=1 Tax=Pyranulibacter aquaticus TaxID=3163344 RepID=UPI003594C556